MTTEVTENYLKAIYNFQEWSTSSVTVGVLAHSLRLAPSTISEQIRKLTSQDLVRHEPYGAIELTEAGRELTLRVVRKHRLIECFLVDYLGYSWDQVHDEAEVLEHAVSQKFIDRLDRKLGFPQFDPHGDPIPQADGTLPDAGHVPLVEVPLGSKVRVARVWDDDPGLLRDLEGIGLALGVTCVVNSKNETLGTIELEQGGQLKTLGLSAAAVIRVVREITPSHLR